jgi:hypothetical protein
MTFKVPVGLACASSQRLGLDRTVTGTARFDQPESWRRTEPLDVDSESSVSQSRLLAPFLGTMMGRKEIVNSFTLPS